MLSLVCGYVSAVFIEVATETGRIDRPIWDRITRIVTDLSRLDFGNQSRVPGWHQKRTGGILGVSVSMIDTARPE